MGRDIGLEHMDHQQQLLIHYLEKSGRKFHSKCLSSVLCF